MLAVDPKRIERIVLSNGHLYRAFSAPSFLIKLPGPLGRAVAFRAFGA